MAEDTILTSDPAAVSRDPATPATPATPTDPAAAAAAKTPEQTAQENQVALSAAEKAVADAKTPEEKAAAEQKLADLKKAQEGGKQPQGAPEKYEAFKFPDGMQPDAAQLAEFEPLARELNLSQAQAQKLVDFDAKRTQAGLHAQTKAWSDLRENWATAAREDKDIGGAKFDENVGLAKAFLKTFGTPALSEFLAQGYGDHPELIRLFANAGRAIGEDKLHVGGSSTQGGQKSLAERLFPGLS